MNECMEKGEELGCEVDEKAFFILAFFLRHTEEKKTPLKNLQKESFHSSRDGTNGRDTVICVFSMHRKKKIQTRSVDEKISDGLKTDVCWGFFFSSF